MTSDATQIGLPIPPESRDMPWTNVKVLVGKKKVVLPGKQEVKRDNLEGADPELCIQYFQRGLNYRGLKNRLKTADQEWIEDFLERDGLTAIFDALTGLGKRGISSVTDALDQLHCVAAVKEVMNRPAGLEYVIEEGSGRSLINTLVLGEFCSVLTRTYRHIWRERERFLARGGTSVTMIVTKSVEFVPAILIKYLNANYFCYKRWRRAIDKDGRRFPAIIVHGRVGYILS